MSKILIVDDEASIRNFCYELFTREGHEVITAPRREQFLTMLKTEKPDLVLMDLNIPGEEGLSLLRSMPNEPGKRVPVVIFSGKVDPEVEKKAYEAGAVEVVQKGLPIKEFRQKIVKILDAKHRIFSDKPSERIEKILIVDDEEGVRKLLATFFQKKGFRVLQAASGEEAVELVKKEKPSVVLLDISLPGMDGVLTLKKIKESHPDTGVIMATGAADETLAKECQDHGAYAYVLKPFDLQYLELVVITRMVIAS